MDKSMRKKTLHEANITAELKNYLEKKWGLELKLENHPDLEYDWKSKKGDHGKPDMIYYDKSEKFILIIEVKNKASKLEEAKKQICRYLDSDFISRENFNIIGISFAGDSLEKSNFLLSCYSKKSKSNWKEINHYDFKEQMNNYKDLFNDHKNKMEIISKVKMLNNILRNVISAEYRARLFCGVMISIYRRPQIVENNFHRLYKQHSDEDISKNIYNQIKIVLEKLDLENVKTNYVLNEFNFFITQKDLFNWIGWKKIIKIINEIFEIMESLNHDLIVTVFREMLRYASGDGKNFGEVMTPTHISDLAIDILDRFKPFDKNSVIFDPTCGTSGLLISAMDKILNKKELTKKEVDEFKKNNMWGVEKDNKMFVYGITNMILNGDGKSNIFLDDSFNKNIKKEIKKKCDKNITHIVMNPPYSMKSIDNNSRNELAFLIQAIKSSEATNGLAIIAPESTFRKEGIFKTQREEILKRSTLKGVIKLPAKVFEPDASTQTVILFLDLAKPHNINKDYIWYYNLEDDGLVKVKNSAREDINKVWESKKNLIIEDLENIKEINKKLKDFENINNWVEPFETHKTVEVTEQDFKDTILERLLFESKINANWNKLKENQAKLKEFENYLKKLKENNNND